MLSAAFSGETNRMPIGTTYATAMAMPPVLGVGALWVRRMPDGEKAPSPRPGGHDRRQPVAERGAER
jgi:hypothetical protein